MSLYNRHSGRMRFSFTLLVLPFLCLPCSSAQNAPPADAFKVLQDAKPGPRITPFLKYQLDQAWRQDEAQQRVWESIRTEEDLFRLQNQMRQSLLEMIGGLPDRKSDLHARITGKIQMDGFSIEKLIYESLPGIYVTALVYAPDDHSREHPAVLVPAGHATNGKIHYQVLSQRLAKRGYVVIAWDPVGQGERSQFWDAKSGKSRYNLVCAEHAVMGNLAYLAGANLARWEIWDGMRAIDYLLTRSDVDPERISITGTSGGGTQTTLIAALDPRIKAIVPSCYITSMPMRMANRIFVDPDSDPEQDLFGLLSNNLGHTGLLLLMYPRPVMVASAVQDFFPIEGARKTFRETQRVYERFQRADRVAMAEGYHGHQYSDENQEAALDFLDRFNGMSLRRGLFAAKELPDKDLLCTPSGQVMLDESNARSLMEVIREYYEASRKSPQEGLASRYKKFGAPGVEKWAVSEFKGAPPAENQIVWSREGGATLGDFQIDKYLLRHSRLLAMPLLYIHKSSSAQSEVALWFKETGKADPSDWPQIETLLRSGHDVVTFDFRGLGETRMPYTAVSPDDPLLGQLDFEHAYRNPISGVLANHVYNSLLSGRPYFYQMIDDAKIAKRFVEENLKVRVTDVAAPGDAFAIAAAVSEVMPDVKAVRGSSSAILKWSELVERKQEAWPIWFLVPGGAYSELKN
ncbi:MAG: acetylxylan esterase [Acidobacteria bacterium]|nr:acetylxylan esterase [Acidobacteriota bacterium]MBS1866686.1 acetylxylan esterase [Acidobacteriota bacterium]